MNNTQICNLIKVGFYLWAHLQVHKLFIEDVDKILDNIDFNEYISFSELMKNYKG